MYLFYFFTVCQLLHICFAVSFPLRIARVISWDLQSILRVTIHDEISVIFLLGVGVDGWWSHFANVAYLCMIFRSSDHQSLSSFSPWLNLGRSGRTRHLCHLCHLCMTHMTLTTHQRISENPTSVRWCKLHWTQDLHHSSSLGPCRVPQWTM